MKKSVVVVGGGPAGMEAARVAALRGHDVTLLEKQHKLGGSLPVAAMIKGPREDIPGLIKYLDRQVHAAGVHVKTGHTATARSVADLHPDVVVVATGGTHHLPDIPGIRGKNVLSAEKLHHLAKDLTQIVPPLTLRRLQSLPVARDVLIGKRVVVMGAALHGCQTAEYLMHLGKQVTIVDTCTQEEIGEGLLEVFMKPYLLYWLKDNGAQFVTRATYDKVTDEGLWITDADASHRLLAADTIVTALPLQPNTAAIDALSQVAPEVYPIGDAADPQLIIDAIAAGSKIAREF